MFFVIVSDKVRHSSEWRVIDPIVERSDLLMGKAGTSKRHCNR